MDTKRTNDVSDCALGHCLRAGHYFVLTRIPETINLFVIVDRVYNG